MPFTAYPTDMQPKGSCSLFASCSLLSPDTSAAAPKAYKHVCIYIYIHIYIYNYIHIQPEKWGVEQTKHMGRWPCFKGCLRVQLVQVCIYIYRFPCKCIIPKMKCLEGDFSTHQCPSHVPMLQNRRLICPHGWSYKIIGTWKHVDFCLAVFSSMFVCFCSKIKGRGCQGTPKRHPPEEKLRAPAHGLMSLAALLGIESSRLAITYTAKQWAGPKKPQMDSEQVASKLF